jgi:hypothetical protein
VSTTIWRWVSLGPVSDVKVHQAFNIVLQWNRRRRQPYCVRRVVIMIVDLRGRRETAVALHQTLKIKAIHCDICGAARSCMSKESSELFCRPVTNLCVSCGKFLAWW